MSLLLVWALIGWIFTDAVLVIVFLRMRRAERKFTKAASDLLALNAYCEELEREQGDVEVAEGEGI